MVFSETRSAVDAPESHLARLPAGKKIMNSLQMLAKFGQSPWFDYIRRSLITSGELARLVTEEGLRGVTSNPAIFKMAIAGSSDYDEVLSQLVQDLKTPVDIYEHIAMADIRDAADILRPVHVQSEERDGFVSLEVSPYLARDTQGTLIEARRLWKAVARPNLMIKVPATPEGIPAIRQLISEGINVNVTLIFAVSAYREVVEAFLSGLEERQQAGKPIAQVASVASFFVSRIDASVDQMLDKKIAATSDDAERTGLRRLLGQTAIANAKVAYEVYQSLFRGERWQKLAAKNAQTQRLLWASTGTKNPAYRDVVYVEELIGAHTVNTIPPATWTAFLDHGVPRESLQSDLSQAHANLADLARHGIALDSVTDELLVAGVKLFADAFDDLLAAVEKRRQVAGT